MATPAPTVLDILHEHLSGPGRGDDEATFGEFATLAVAEELRTQNLLSLARLLIEHPGTPGAGYPRHEANRLAARYAKAAADRLPLPLSATNEKERP